MARTIELTFKTPDVLDQLDQDYPGGVPSVDDERYDEYLKIKKDLKSKIKYGEYITVVYDIETKKLTVKE